MTQEVFQAVDHIMVRVNEAEPMMRLFSETLGLPVSWPLQQNDVATYGWITLGNTNLEFWASVNNGDLPTGQLLPMFHGFALAPYELSRSIGILEQRGIRCKAPRSYATKNREGKEVTNFTNSVILDVSNDLCCIFFCDWGAEGTIFPWPKKHTLEDRRAAAMANMKSCGGGKLGVTGLIEIRLASTDVDESYTKWAAITGQESGPLLLDGIRLCLRSGAKNMIDSLVLGVRSLHGARDVLAKLDLLGTDQGDEIVLSDKATAGLQFRLREVNAV